MTPLKVVHGISVIESYGQATVNMCIDGLRKDGYVVFDVRPVYGDHILRFVVVYGAYESPA